MTLKIKASREKGNAIRFERTERDFPSKYIRTSRYYRRLSIVDRLFLIRKIIPNSVIRTYIADQDLSRGESKGFQNPLFS